MQRKRSNILIFFFFNNHYSKRFFLTPITKWNGESTRTSDEPGYKRTNSGRFENVRAAALANGSAFDVDRMDFLYRP